MHGPIDRLSYASKLGAYSVLGASAFPLVAARVLAHQRRRSSIPPAPSSTIPRTDPRGTGAVSTLRAFMPDLAIYLAELDRTQSRLAYHYPRAFERCAVEVAPGVTLACRIAAHPVAKRHETLLFVPGMFATATQNVVVRLAMRAHQRWGYNVVVADMRDFGETARLNHSPCAMGAHEADDVVALGRWARARFDTPSVSVLGYSYGGAVTLGAALRGAGTLDACIAFCPPLYARDLIAHFSQPVRGLSSFSLFQIFYQWLLLCAAKARGRDDVEHFADYVSKVITSHYGIDEDALYAAADVRSRIAELRVPTLVIHADDDPVVPYQHSVELRDEARRHGNDKLHVTISRGGGHYGHWSVMPRWTEQTVLEFLARTRKGAPA